MPPLVSNKEINSISDVSNLLRLLPRSDDGNKSFWFRGMCKPAEKRRELVPNIFRKTYASRAPEINITLDFMQEAPTFLETVPEMPWHNHYSCWYWLYLMQHYGLPTRLLDWSESIYVAIYFAVRDVDNKKDKSEKRSKYNGELWFINPRALNQKTVDTSGVSSPDFRNISDEQALYMASCAFTDKPFDLLNTFNRVRKHFPLCPLALKPMKQFPRMVSQLSVFTIHPDPKLILPKRKRTYCNIKNVLAENKEYFRCIIPKGQKNHILEELKDMGISQHTLFPELEYLCNDIKQKYVQ